MMNDQATARAIVMNSDAIGMAMPVQIEWELKRGVLRALPFREPWLRLDYGFLYLQNRSLPPAAEVFMQLVRSIEIDVAKSGRELVDEVTGLPA